MTTMGRGAPPPDLTDFMNDMFFGTVQADPKSYDLSGAIERKKTPYKEEEYDNESPKGKCKSSTNSTTSNTSKMTQEWLDEARRIVASSPSRRSISDSPTSRLGGSPRFAAQGRYGAASLFTERRDPLSRSARREKTVEGFSGEILIRSVKHSRNKSETLAPPPISSVDGGDLTPVQKWFSTILKPPAVPNSSELLSTSSDPVLTNLPPRQLVNRKSRFQTTDPAITSRRTFRAEKPDGSLIESPRRKSRSLRDDGVLSPPRNLVESSHRRSISSNTCFVVKCLVKDDENEKLNFGRDLNGFLKQQRLRINKVLDGEGCLKVKIVLSGTSNSTSSMLAAICYAWLLENTIGNDLERGENELVVPVINVARSRMWKLRQAAWLFHHVGIDTSALLFADEVDLENMITSRKLSILLVGQDVLRSTQEVRSQCTTLTDNYCEDAYDLLQTPELKKLLLAGILLDTQNLNASAKSSMTRDAEAVQLLLVGSSLNYRNTLYDQLMHEHKDETFLQVLRNNYGKHQHEIVHGTGAMNESEVSVTGMSTSNSYTVQHTDKGINGTRNDRANRVSTQAAKAEPTMIQEPTAAKAQESADSRVKNKFSLAKWFGFGGK